MPDKSGKIVGIIAYFGLVCRTCIFSIALDFVSRILVGDEGEE